MRIYIIPSGWDRELVQKTIFKSSADKVCLISAHAKKQHTYTRADRITQNITTYLLENLSKFTDVEVLEVNYIDFQNIFVTVNDYVKKHTNDEIIINISTGSHLLAATLICVAHMNNIPVQYSIAQNHNDNIMQLIERGENYHSGFTELITLPTIPFTISFNAKEKELLKKISTQKTINVADFIDGATGNRENRLRSEFHYTTKKLEKNGVVRIINQGNRVEIELTPFGKLCVQK